MAKQKSEKRRVRLDEKGRPRPTAGLREREPEFECDCPQLDADDWHQVESDWSDIAFLKGAVTAAAGVPVGFNAERRKLRERAEALGIPVPEDAMILLGEGKVRRPVLLEVEPDTDRDDVYRPGGYTWSRLVAAPFGQMKGEAKATREEATERFGRPPDNLWVWYLTCSECSGPRDFETLFVAHYKGG